MSAGPRKLRLTLVGPLPPPPGGMANQTQQLAHLLRGEGAHVEVVRSNAPYSPRWIERVPVVRALFRLVPYVVSLWRAAGTSDLFHVMANSGWSWHLFAAPAIRIAAWRKVPVIVNYRGGDAAPFLARAHRSVRSTLALADALIVPSGFLQSVFARHGIPSEVVPNAVDLETFHPPVLPRQRGAHLVVLRNLEAMYDNATAIRALARMKQRRSDARLTIAGSGPERESLETLARSLRVEASVHFAGRLDRQQVADLLRTADLLLNPSTVDNMPNSLLEALASGVPIVSTDVGGVPFVVRNGETALLVGAGDDAAMAGAALRIIDDEEHARRLVAAGLELARRYDWASVHSVLAEQYRRATPLARSVSHA